MITPGECQSWKSIRNESIDKKTQHQFDNLISYYDHATPIDVLHIISRLASGEECEECVDADEALNLIDRMCRYCEELMRNK